MNRNYLAPNVIPVKDAKFGVVKMVGWINPLIPFDTGETPLGIREKIEIIAEKNEVLRIRSLYCCPICRQLRQTCSNLQDAQFNDWCCNTSFMVPGEDCYYYSPCLISHSIRVHQYRPPQEFLDAVDCLDLDLWDAEYKAA